MKVLEIINEMKGPPLTDEHLDMAFNAIDGHPEMTGRELEHKSREIIDDGYTRSNQSARNLMLRMYVAMYGKGPEGYHPTEDWVKVSKKIYKYLQGKGIEVDANLRKLHNSLGLEYDENKYKKRMAKRKPFERRKTSRNTATEAMSNAARSLHPDVRKKLSAHREDIISDIMLGLTPGEAFNRRL